MLRPVARGLVLQLRIMIDAIDADGGLRITLKAMVRLCATGKAMIDDIDGFALTPTQSTTPIVVAIAPAPPDARQPSARGMRHMGGRKTPATERIPPSCRCAATGSTPVCGSASKEGHQQISSQPLNLL
jgi:hypothetical protein